MEAEIEREREQRQLDLEMCKLEADEEQRQITFKMRQMELEAETARLASGPTVPVCEPSSPAVSSNTYLLLLLSVQNALDDQFL